ncbi:MAG: hypothetical protein H6851_17995 [Geminicoccaceae bacterium]|nr:hypothetical protein [Geminicoccaceae bacterium]
MVGRVLDLPLQDAPLNKVLTWLAAGLAFIAVVAVSVAVIAHAQLRELLREPLMVTIAMPSLNESSSGVPAAGRADPMGEVVNWLKVQPGVLFVDPLSDSELGKLVEPWLSDPQATDSLPMPRLIDVGLNAWNPPDLDELGRKLQEIVPGTAIGETGSTQDARKHTLEFTRMAAIGIAGAALFICMIAFIYITRIHVRFERDSIDLLRQMGASDGYLAHQFELHALFRAFRGGLWGFGCAAATLLLAIYGNRLIQYELPFSIRLLPFDWFVLAVPPMVMALLVAVGARLSAHLGLLRQP